MDTTALDQVAGISGLMILIEIMGGLLWVFYSNRKNEPHSLYSAVPWLKWFMVGVILLFMLALSMRIATATGWDFLPLLVPLFSAGLWIRHSFLPSPHWRAAWWPWSDRSKS